MDQRKAAARSSVGCMISPKWSMAKNPTDTYKCWGFECQNFDYSHHFIITAKFPKDGDFGEPSATPSVPAVAFPMLPTPPPQQSDSPILSTPPATASQPPTPQPPTSQPPALPLTPQQPTSSRGGPILYDMIVVEPLPSKQHSFSTPSHTPSNAEPISYENALSRSNAPQWIQAMNEEMDSIHQNGTWNLEDLAPGGKSIGVKWVFKIKRDALNKFQGALLQRDIPKWQGWTLIKPLPLWSESTLYASLLLQLTWVCISSMQTARLRSSMVPQTSRYTVNRQKGSSQDIILTRSYA